MVRSGSWKHVVRERPVRGRGVHSMNGGAYKAPRSYKTNRCHWQRDGYSEQQGQHNEQRVRYSEHWDTCHIERGRGYRHRGGSHEQREIGYGQRGRGYGQRGRGYGQRGRGHEQQRGRGRVQRGRGRNNEPWRGYMGQGARLSYRGSETNQTDDEIDELESLQNENPSKIVAELNNKQRIMKYINLCNKSSRFNRKFIKLLDEAFKCLTTPALLLNVLNVLKETDFIRKSIDQLKASFQDDEGDKDSVIDAVSSLIRLLMWTAQKNPSAIAFLLGSRVFLSGFIEDINESANIRKPVSKSFVNSHKRLFPLGDTGDKDDEPQTNDDNDGVMTDSSSDSVIYRLSFCFDRRLEKLDGTQCDSGSDETESILLCHSGETIESINKEGNPIDDCDSDNNMLTEDENNIDKYSLEKGTIQVEMKSNEVEASNKDTSIDTASCSMINTDKKDNGISYSETMSKKVRDLGELFNNFKECLNHSNTKKECHNVQVEDPDEFRSLPIIPRLEDITGEVKPKLRALKVKGAYKSVSDYLDIHFRLLREDFISPLRNAVLTYSGQMPSKSRRQFQDIKVYENVRIIAPIFRDGIQHMLEFDVSKLGNIHWSMSKRLKYGSLVCLSKDNFRTCHFATISNSDIRYKRQGSLHVQFEHNIATVNTLMNECFTMVESPAYFEAYRHVLLCLQHMTENDFPLAKYIVDGSNDVQPPLYMQVHDQEEGMLSPPTNDDVGIQAPTAIDVDRSQSPTTIDDDRIQSPTIIDDDRNKSPTIIDDDRIQSSTTIDGDRIQSPITVDDDRVQSPTTIDDDRVQSPTTIDDDRVQSPTTIDDDRVQSPTTIDDDRIQSPTVNDDDRMQSPTTIDDDRIQSPTVNDDDRIQSPTVIDDDRIQSPTTIDDDRIQSPTVNDDDRIQSPTVIDDDRIQSPTVNDDDSVQSPTSIDDNGIKLSTTVDDALIPSPTTIDDDFVSLDVLGGILHNADTLRLDSSQSDAFKAALTNEISLIQGPPGCGKTFVGLLIVKWLLKNKRVWSRYFFPFRKQLLVVCYTNHALDQFLEGICSFYSPSGDIVRVGSRSKSEALEKHSLPNKRKEYRKLKRYPGHIHNARRGIIGAIKDIEYSLNIYSMQMKLLKRNIASAESLSDVMGPFLKQFQWGKSKRVTLDPWLQYLGNDVMTHWLGVHKLAQDISNDTYRHTGQYQYLDDLTDASITFEPREVISEIRFDYDDEEKTEQSYQITRFRAQNIAVDLDALTKNLSNVPHYKKKCVTLERERVKKFLRKKMHSSAESPDKESVNQTNTNIFNERFSQENRWKLYQTWIERKCNLIMEKMSESLTDLEEAYRRKREVLMLEDAHILKNADVVGMTTTGAAKINNILKEVQPAIMIVEEAAEVLESHLISNLTAGCKQLILIGDHKQLKPKPEVYKLEIDYNLNLSLFERLINNGIKCHTLQVQHRMRPAIADNIRNIYEDLQDHDSVKDYEMINGIKYPTFFINHSVHENKNDELKSFVNEHEALYIVHLCKYLLLQGYPGAKITILTMYKGQMFYIKKEMLKLQQGLENILVTVVDNYQGEENDIVLLSFVRSNEDNRVGFVALDNRVCVALSRAKKGMYAIGNFEQLSKVSSLWKSVVSGVKTRGFYGTELHLICQNHDRDEGILAKTFEDFAKAPEGGCMKPCDTRLDCGHVCNRKCHVTNRDHNDTICEKPCTKKCVFGHPCQELCNQECFCYVDVQITLGCGHSMTFICSQGPDAFICEEICGKPLPCGHSCQLLCNDPCKCNTLVKRKLRKCGHEVDLPCCTDQETVRCSQKCDKVMPCGHRCTKICRDDCSPCSHKRTILRPDCGHKDEVLCEHDTDQFMCQRACGLIMECGHTCQTMCGEEADMASTADPQHCPKGHMSDCDENCNKILSCGHQCQGSCFQCSKNGWHLSCYKTCDIDLICGHRTNAQCSIFTSCNETCSRTCQHKKCTMPCDQICKPCTKPCAWQCKHHNCTKLCGEPCDRPRCDASCEKELDCGHKCCGLCGDPCPLICVICDELQGNNDNTQFVQLQDCGHICPADKMDELMDMGSRYFNQCPYCYTTIVTTNGNRYEGVVNAHWKNLNECKAMNANLSRELYLRSKRSSCNIRQHLSISPIPEHVNYYNNLSIMWCVEAICHNHSIRYQDFQLPSHKLNKFTAQMVEDLKKKIQYYLVLFTECNSKNGTTTSRESEHYSIDTSGTIQRYGSSTEYTTPKLSLRSSRFNHPNQSQVQVKILINHCLPYLTVEEETVFEDNSDAKKEIWDLKGRLPELSKTNAEIDGPCVPPDDLESYKVDRNSCGNEIDDEPTTIAVAETINSLLNTVCQKRNVFPEGMCNNIEQFPQQMETLSNQAVITPSSPVVTNVDNQTSDGSFPPEVSTTTVTKRLKEIQILDHIDEWYDPIDETSALKDSVTSTTYTIHLMKLPWEDFRSNESTNTRSSPSLSASPVASSDSGSTDGTLCATTNNKEDTIISCTSENGACTVYKVNSLKRKHEQISTETDYAQDETQHEDIRLLRILSPDSNHENRSTDSGQGREQRHWHSRGHTDKYEYGSKSKHRVKQHKGGHTSRHRDQKHESRHTSRHRDQPHEGGHTSRHRDQQHEGGHTSRHREKPHEGGHTSRHRDQQHDGGHTSRHRDQQHEGGHTSRHRDKQHEGGHTSRHRDKQHDGGHTSRHRDQQHEGGHTSRHLDKQHKGGHTSRHRDKPHEGGHTSRHRDKQHEGGHTSRYRDNQHEGGHTSRYRDKQHEGGHTSRHRDKQHGSVRDNGDECIDGCARNEEDEYKDGHKRADAFDRKDGHARDIFDEYKEGSNIVHGEDNIGGHPLDCVGECKDRLARDDETVYGERRTLDDDIECKDGHRSNECEDRRTNADNEEYAEGRARDASDGRKDGRTKDGEEKCKDGRARDNDDECTAGCSRDANDECIDGRDIHYGDGYKDVLAEDEDAKSNRDVQGRTMGSVERHMEHGKLDPDVVITNKPGLKRKSSEQNVHLSKISRTEEVEDGEINFI